MQITDIIKGKVEVDVMVYLYDEKGEGKAIVHIDPLAIFETNPSQSSGTK